MNSRSTLLVEPDAVQRHSSYDQLIPIISDAFREYHTGNVVMPEKRYLYIEEYNGDFRSMPAYINGEYTQSQFDTSEFIASGIKWVNVHPDNTDLPTVMGVVVYTDPKTGEPLAILNGTEVTGRRTGAVAAVATDELSTPDASSLGLIGAGAQAYEQLRAISTVRDIERVVIVDKNQDAVDRFVEKFKNEFIMEVGSVDDATSCDILSTTTPVSQPIIDSVADGIHINAMGADAPNKQEFNLSVLYRDTTNIIVDDMEQCIHSGEVSKAIQSGQLTRDDIYGTLGSVITTQSNSDLKSTTTLFDSTGLAIQDIATAHLIYNSIANSTDSVDKLNIM